MNHTSDAAADLSPSINVGNVSLTALFDESMSDHDKLDESIMSPPQIIPIRRLSSKSTREISLSTTTSKLFTKHKETFKAKPTDRPELSAAKNPANQDATEGCSFVTSTPIGRTIKSRLERVNRLDNPDKTDRVKDPGFSETLASDEEETPSYPVTSAPLSRKVSSKRKQKNNKSTRSTDEDDSDFMSNHDEITLTREALPPGGRKQKGASKQKHKKARTEKETKADDWLDRIESCEDISKTTETQIDDGLGTLLSKFRRDGKKQVDRLQHSATLPKGPPPRNDPLSEDRNTPGSEEDRTTVVMKEKREDTSKVEKVIGNSPDERTNSSTKRRSVSQSTLRKLNKFAFTDSELERGTTNTGDITKCSLPEVNSATAPKINGAGAKNNDVTSAGNSVSLQPSPASAGVLNDSHVNLSFMDSPAPTPDVPIDSSKLRKAGSICTPTVTSLRAPSSAPFRTQTNRSGRAVPLMTPGGASDRLRKVCASLSKRTKNMSEKPHFSQGNVTSVVSEDKDDHEKAMSESKKTLPTMFHKSKSSLNSPGVSNNLPTSSPLLPLPTRSIFSTGDDLTDVDLDFDDLGWAPPVTKKTKV